MELRADILGRPIAKSGAGRDRCGSQEQANTALLKGGTRKTEANLIRGTIYNARGDERGVESLEMRCFTVAK
jgi:hypothetical protein